MAPFRQVLISRDHPRLKFRQKVSLLVTYNYYRLAAHVQAADGPDAMVFYRAPYDLPTFIPYTVGEIVPYPVTAIKMQRDQLPGTVASRRRPFPDSTTSTYPTRQFGRFARMYG